LAARLHPTKAEAFECIVTGQCSVASEDSPSAVLPDVQFYVNTPQGGTAVRHFSEFLESCRRLRDHEQSDDVLATISLSGFEPDAEPVLREMRNGSLLLIFAFIPPRVCEDQPNKVKRFDLNTFGAEIEKAAGVTVVWDDKEVFVIQRPRSGTVERIRCFLQSYWESSKR
jgi:hypothetical protein